MSTVQTEQHGVETQADDVWDFKAPVQTRSQRFKSTQLQDYPKVTGREGNWKYTPVADLQSLLNDQLNGEQLEVEIDEAPGLSIEWVDRNSPVIGRAGIPEERPSANAWGSFEKALHLKFTSEETQTVHVRRDSLDSTPRGAHTVVEAMPHSQSLVIMENTGAAHLSENVEIVVGDGAKLTIVSVQEWDDEAIHLASHFSVIGRDASLTHIVVTLGGKIVRLNPTLHLKNEGGNGEAYGAYFADAGQHMEHQVFIDHNAPHTRSRVTYKGALQGEAAHTVWIGDVLIQRNASGTDTYEENRNLVLSEGTRADSIPNLEIETGDIAGAGHASATGRFDEEHLFYLMSRGISEEEARKLVVRGFLLEVISKIGEDATEKRLQHAVEDALKKGVFA